jgi:hypothetical protein
MYYLLGYKLLSEPLDARRKQTLADNTYIGRLSHEEKMITRDEVEIFFLSVIIYHNTRIHGQYIFYYTECVMICM